MSDYISREYVLNCMEDSYKNAGISAEAASKVRKWLYKAPVADVRENKRGKWICIQDELCECSECARYWIPFGDAYDFHFCPNCGADMREES